MEHLEAANRPPAEGGRPIRPQVRGQPSHDVLVPAEPVLSAPRQPVVAPGVGEHLCVAPDLWVCIEQAHEGAAGRARLRIDEEALPASKARPCCAPCRLRQSRRAHVCAPVAPLLASWISLQGTCESAVWTDRGDESDRGASARARPRVGGDIYLVTTDFSLGSQPRFTGVEPRLQHLCAPQLSSPAALLCTRDAFMQEDLVS